MRVIQLLATDLDGTLIGSAREFPLYSSFREKMAELRRNYGTIWVACTGRPLRSFRTFFSPMCAMGMTPDFVVVNHAYIFERTRAGYMPHFFWNLRIAYIVWLNRITAREVMGDWHDAITGMSGGVATLKRTKDRLRLRFDSEDSARVAMGVLQEKQEDYRHLQIFLSGRELDVRAVPFTKGLSVSELARHLEIKRDEILTIGNGYNDISMLDSKVAGMTACPINSEAEVMSAVHKAGGHISRERALGGVMDSINAWLNCTVDSSLPEHWVPPDQKSFEGPRKSARRRKIRFTWRQGVLAGCAAYAVLVVFANYGMIPFVSQYIMIPYQMALKVMTKLVTVFWS